MLKKYILNKGHPKLSRGNPRPISSMGVEFYDVKLKNCFEPLTLLLCNDSMGWAESGTDSDSEYSSDSDSSSDSSQPRKRLSPESPRNSAADRPSRVQRRHDYEHARRRIRDKISELSDIDTAIYLLLRKLN